MNIEQTLQEAILQAIKALYGADVEESSITLQKTKREFTGHYTLVTFPLLRVSKKKPEETGQEIGNYLVESSEVVTQFNVIKGFLNLTIAPATWVRLLEDIDGKPDYGFVPVADDAPLFMVEYSSPNTNKPLHLGHVRNNLLGHALSEVLKANGKRVVKTNLVNDRGIHICKSMLAWQLWGYGETPAVVREERRPPGGRLLRAVRSRNIRRSSRVATRQRTYLKEEAEAKSPS
jgi:arginyl-tRNA synthetase